MRGSWKLLGGASVGALALVLLLSSSVRGQGDGDGDDEEELPSMPTSEPATEPLGTTPRWEAHTPYEQGPGATPYEQMTPGDKASADAVIAGEDERASVLAVYEISAKAEFDRGMILLAQARLGIEGLGDIGVIGGGGQ